MYVETRETTGKGKTCIYHYLRQSYREGRKVGHDRIANPSRCSEEEVEAIRLALKHKVASCQIHRVHISWGSPPAQQCPSGAAISRHPHPAYSVSPALR